MVLDEGTKKTLMFNTSFNWDIVWNLFNCQIPDLR